MVYVQSNELTHYGILGMKWGIRRYQNPDGTLTEQGKKRYGTEENLEAGKTQRQIKRHEKAKQEAINSGSVDKVQKFSKELTPEQMQRAFQRIKDEQTLKDLKEKDLERGRASLEEVQKNVGNVKTMSESFVGIYNVAAKAYNAFNTDGKRLPIIGESENKTAKALDQAKLEWQRLVNEQKRKEINQNDERWKWEKEQNADEASGGTKVYERKRK